MTTPLSYHFKLDGLSRKESFPSALSVAEEARLSCFSPKRQQYANHDKADLATEHASEVLLLHPQPEEGEKIGAGDEAEEFVALHHDRDPAAVKHA